MASRPLEITGLDNLVIKLRGLTNEVAEDIGHEIEESGDTIVKAAKRDAPTDQAFLKGGISKVKINPLTVEVVSAASYSAFIEFGTGAKVQIPEGLEEFAAKFKGQKGPGTLNDFFENILAWVKRVGASGTYSVKSKKRVLTTRPGKYQSRSYVLDQEDRKAAYAIMYSILRNGVTPHPYFFKNFLIEKPKLIERIKKILGQ